MTGRIHRWALRVDLGRLAGVLACVIAAFGALGLMEYDGASLGLFHLDGEGKPPAIFSALLLAGAGTLGLLLHELCDERRWLGFGLFLVFMGADDLLTIHEHLQTWTGIDWVYLYLPVIAAGGVVWLLVLRRFIERSRTAVVLLAVGAGAWLAAYVVEQLEYTRGQQDDFYGLFATLEELLEMTGSSLFGFALLVFIRQLPRD